MPWTYQQEVAAVRLLEGIRAAAQELADEAGFVLLSVDPVFKPKDDGG